MRYRSRSKQLQLHANTPFTALTGIETFIVHNDNECHITKALTHKDHPIQSHAYGLYSGIYPKYKYNHKIKVTNTCGVKNCVKQDHLQAVYHPSKDDIERLTTYLRFSTIESLAHQLDVTPQLLQQYIDTHIDII